MHARRLMLAAVVLTVLAAPILMSLRPVGSDADTPGLLADVLIVGGSPAGVAAALAAARQGMAVILTEPRPFLGTVLTGAMLNMLDLNRSPGTNRSLNGGIFRELYREVGGVTFDPRQVRRILLDKVEEEPGITLLLVTDLVRPVIKDTRITGAQVRMPKGMVTEISAAVVIDATDDGDLAAAAGVPYTVGRETSGIDRRMMPATLMFRADDLDWPEIARYASARRFGPQPSGVYKGYVWGFRDLMRGYVPNGDHLSAHDLNIGRLADGSALVNSLQIHDADWTSHEERREAYARAKEEIPNLLSYLRERVPGFSKAQLVEIAPELYIRESRHVKGLYTLTGDDITRQERFWDRIGAASYPIDLHQYVKGERYSTSVERSPYTIPLRSLIAAGVDNLLVASRAFSATYTAAGSARVVPTTVVMGEGAGVAAAVAVEHHATAHELGARPDLVREVQRRLLRAGAILDF